MKIGGRYKLIGKKKHAILDLPYDEVLNTFEKALCNNDPDSRLSGSVNRETGIFKIEYKISERKNDYYENYCLLVEITEAEDGDTRIEYAFVYDRLVSLYTKFLSVICFLVPLVAALFIYFKFELKDLVHLALYIPLLLISAFGVFSLFGYNERKEQVKPMIKEFEHLLISSFDE